MTNTLTHTTITRLPELVPNMRQLKLAITCAEQRCGEAAVLADEAYRMYDAAIDDEKPYPVRNDLWGHYQFALGVLSECKRQRDAAKRDLLDMWQ